MKIGSESSELRSFNLTGFVLVVSSYNDPVKRCKLNGIATVKNDF